MVKYTYTSLSHELNQKIASLLKQVWNYKHHLERLDHSEKNAVIILLDFIGVLTV